MSKNDKCDKCGLCRTPLKRIDQDLYVCPKCHPELAQERRRIDNPAEIARIAEAQIDCLTRQIAKRDARIAELEAIVNKLPKTADGVAAYPEMTVWLPDYCGEKPCSLDLVLGCGYEGEIPAEECYSTREAAEKEKP